MSRNKGNCAHLQIDMCERFHGDVARVQFAPLLRQDEILLETVQYLLGALSQLFGRLLAALTAAHQITGAPFSRLNWIGLDNVLEYNSAD